QPAASSWGLGGYSEFWLNEANDWIYPLLNKACAQMVEMTSRYPQAKGWIHRALNQAARELLLAQASDWAFMMKTGNHRAYAESRVKGHLFGFSRLYDQVSVGKIDRKFLEELEERENLFPDLDYRIYQKL
ncbi:MAG TPA: 1,4-alpha-glucan branching protein domain-containing protein, partial [bacterium]